MENWVNLSGSATKISELEDDGEYSRNCVELNETSTLMESQATESKGTDWTDEKHSLYLKSMETTFVNQLHKSLDLFGWQSQQNCPSKPKSSKHMTCSCAPSGQFKVFRDGFWSKVDFTRDEPRVNKAEDSGCLSANAWIQLYSSADRQTAKRFSDSLVKDPSPTTLNQFPAHKFRLWRQDSMGSNTEVTDQNFNGEDIEEEKSDGAHVMKKMKTSTEDILSNDQVVPCGISQVEIVAEDQVSTED